LSRKQCIPAIRCAKLADEYASAPQWRRQRKQLGSGRHYAALRLRVYNAANKYAWVAGTSGIQTYEPERRIMLSLTLGN